MMDQKKRLLMILRNARGLSPEQTADLLVRSGVLVPAISIGQVVYFVCSGRYVRAYRVYCIHYIDGKVFRYFGSSEDGGLPLFMPFTDEQIGKHWFVSSEDAYAELERRRECRQ